MSERTFVMLKPDAIVRGLMGVILSRVERKGYNIVAMKLIQMTRSQAEKLYEMHRGRPFFKDLVSHVISAPVLVMIVEGPGAVGSMRALSGVTNPLEAATGTIRGDFGLTVTKNVIHAADSLRRAEEETSIFFKPEEITSYRKPTESEFAL